MRRSNTPSIQDILTEDFLQDGLKALGADFRGWRQADGRGNRQLWSMLGRVHELGAKIEGNSAAKLKLVSKVQAEPSVKGNNRWHADRKTPQELLLTLLLGLREETKATKSQWLGAIRAAKKADIPADQKEYVTWMKSIGGVNAARRTAQKKPRIEEADLKAWAEKLEGFEWDEDAAPAPAPFMLEQLPAKIGLVLVKQVDEKGRVQPIATLIDEKLLIKAIKGYLTDVDRAHKQAAYSVAELAKTRQRAAKANWKKYSKTGNYSGTLAEYVADGAPEF